MYILANCQPASGVELLLANCQVVASLTSCDDEGGELSPPKVSQLVVTIKSSCGSYLSCNENYWKLRILRRILCWILFLKNYYSNFFKPLNTFWSTFFSLPIFFQVSCHPAELVIVYHSTVKRGLQIPNKFAPCFVFFFLKSTSCCILSWFYRPGVSACHESRYSATVLVAANKVTQTKFFAFFF